MTVDTPKNDKDEYKQLVVYFRELIRSNGSPEIAAETIIERLRLAWQEGLLRAFKLMDRVDNHVGQAQARAIIYADIELSRQFGRVKQSRGGK